MRTLRKGRGRRLLAIFQGTREGPVLSERQRKTRRFCDAVVLGLLHSLSRSIEITPNRVPNPDTPTPGPCLTDGTSEHGRLAAGAIK